MATPVVRSCTSAGLYSAIGMLLLSRRLGFSGRALRDSPEPCEADILLERPVDNYGLYISISQSLTLRRRRLNLPQEKKGFQYASHYHFKVL